MVMNHLGISFPQSHNVPEEDSDVPSSGEKGPTKTLGEPLVFLNVREQSPSEGRVRKHHADS